MVTRKRLSGRRLQRLRGAVLARDGWACRYCGEPAETIDHVLRVRDGGSDDMANLVAACWPCQRARELSADTVARAVRFFSEGAPETRQFPRNISPPTVGIRTIRGDRSRNP